MAALLAFVLWMPRVASAQEDRPQIMPGERRAPRKKDSGPRAMGVVQLAANGKASLVPITILINGKFWDASSYKADPIPMALEPGTVYEAERTGNSLGLFTVGSALHSNVANNQIPWLATGAWRPTGTEPKTKELKAESAPVGIEDLDAPPRLTRDPNAVKAAPPPKPAPASTGSAPAAPPDSDKPRPDSDEPPRLTKGTSPPAEPPASSPSGSQNPPASNAPSASNGPSASGDSKSTGDAKPEANKPADSKPNEGKTSDSKPSDAKQDDRANIPASDSGAREGSRPRLRRGKPAESFADEDVPGYSRPGVKPASDSANAGKVVETAAATKSDVQYIPAISDATAAPLRPFNFDWLKGEEDDRRKQMTALAKEQIRAYVEGRAKANVVTKTAHSQTARRVATPEPILETVQMVAYDLWRSNQPVLILSAEAHMPPPPAGTAHSEYDTDLQYSIVLVAYPDIYNNLHKLYVGVTDKFHLDVTPRLELIDAVDVDGDGIGELLFRETSDAGAGWVIYRATADKLWKMFDSLRPE